MINYTDIISIVIPCYFTDEVINIDKYFEYLPSDWETLYMGGNHNTHIGVPPPININDCVVKLHNTYSTHFVGIKSKIFEDILDYIRYKNKPIDIIYSVLQNKNVDYNWLIT